MQPRRCARFEGSERSPTSLWSHYTTLKPSGNLDASTQTTSPRDCILRRCRHFGGNLGGSPALNHQQWQGLRLGCHDQPTICRVDQVKHIGT